MQIKSPALKLAALIGLATTSLQGSSDNNASAILQSLSSSDISIENALLSWRGSQTNWNNSLSLSRNRSAIDYAPSSLDLVGNATNRSESLTSLSFETSYKHNEKLETKYSLNYYDGFSDYRSVWLDEFYRQQFEPVPGYEMANPHGYSASIGTRIEYIPTTARLDLNAGYQYDKISPAYEAIPFEPLQQGESQIETYFTSISSENLLTERLKVRFQLRLTNSTNRDLRAFFGLRAHYAIKENWALKTDLGSTRESTEFDSKQIGLAVERNLTGNLVAGLIARYYEDSGEISDPTILSTAAPELSTKLQAFNLSWTGDQLSFHLMAGRYQTDYGPLPDISFQFENLYRDRDWDLLRLSSKYAF